MRNNIYENCYVEKCNNFGTAIVDGKFPASGSFINISDFSHYAWLVFAGTLDSALTLQAEVADAADGTPADVTGATDIIAADDDNEWVVIEVEAVHGGSGSEFATLDVTGAGGGNDFLCIVFVGWNARHRPVTQPAGFSSNVLIAG